MEVVAVDQTISAYKQIRTPKKINRAFSSVASENLTTTNIRGGLLNAPPPSLSFSYPPSASLLTHHQYRHIQQQQQQQQQQQKQPPLLPLPIPRPHPQSPPSRNRGFSCPPKANRGRDHSVTPKKSKSKPSSIPKVELESKSTSQGLIVTSTNRLGPEPNDIPKDVSKVLWSSSTGKSNTSVVSLEDLEKFSGSVFSLAPPPSSLPLPRFSLRPKLSCNAEATGIDAGATDNLCRLLRLR